MNEEWRAIPGYEGIYEASSLGRVRRIVALRKARPPGVLRQHQNNWSCMHLHLYKDKVATNFHAHRLVAAAFLGMSSLEVNHKNGDRTDNRLENLEYVTRAENVAHAMRMGLVARGERNGASRLTIDAVRAIRSRYAAGGVSYWSLAREYGVTQMAVSKIVRRKTWAHVA